MRATLMTLLALLCSGCPDEEPIDPLNPAASRPQPIRPAAPRLKEAPEPGLPSGSWADARVGDRVEVSATGRRWSTRDPEQQHEQAWGSHYALEVVTVEPATVWVKVQAWRADGSVAEGLIPVEPAQAQPPEAPQGAKWSTDEVKVGELSFRCSKWSLDERPADGPLREGCVSEQPPLYLSGVVYRRLQGSGFGGGMELGDVKLLAAVRGKPDQSGTLPALPVLFPKNSWWISLPEDPHQNGGIGWQHDARVVGRQVVSRRRELTQVLRSAADLERTDLFALGDHHFSVSPWHETVAGLDETLNELARPPGSGAASTRHTTHGDLQVVKTGGGLYFADPLDRKLDGLAWPGRSGMADVVTDWGTGELQPLPPAPGTKPEVLSVEEVRAKVNALKDQTRCQRPKPPKGSDGWAVSVFVDAPVEGAITARVEPRPGVSAPAKLLKCFEAGLRKLTLPAHTQPQTPIEVGVTL